jgi:hypothetical protein
MSFAAASDCRTIAIYEYTQTSLASTMLTEHELRKLFTNLANRIEAMATTVENTVVKTIVEQHQQRPEATPTPIIIGIVIGAFIFAFGIFVGTLLKSGMQ